MKLIFIKDSQYLQHVQEQPPGVLQPFSASLTSQVAMVVEQMLDRPVDANQPLMEAGLDSLGAVDLRTALGARFGIELPATVTFDYPSISALASFIANQHLPAGQVGRTQME
jgi:acyl carrier protein